MCQCSDRILTVEVTDLTEEELVARYLRRRAQLSDFRLTSEIRTFVEGDLRQIIGQIKKLGPLTEEGRNVRSNEFPGLE